MNNIIIRPSTSEDVKAVHGIYQREVLQGTATFDETPPSLEALMLKRQTILDLGFPYLVAEMDGVVVAYSYVSLYRERSAYSKTVENAVYINPDFHKMGIGSKLMEALLAECEKCGLKNIIAVIGDSENLGSINLHTKFGFRKIGILREVGFKFSRWIDIVLMQKSL